MMSERREDPEEGLLLYLKQNDMSAVPVKPENTRGHTHMTVTHTCAYTHTCMLMYTHMHMHTHTTHTHTHRGMHSMLEVLFLSNLKTCQANFNTHHMHVCTCVYSQRQTCKLWHYSVFHSVSVGTLAVPTTYWHFCLGSRPASTAQWDGLLPESPDAERDRGRWSRDLSPGTSAVTHKQPEIMQQVPSAHELCCVSEVRVQCSLSLPSLQSLSHSFLAVPFLQRVFLLIVRVPSQLLLAYIVRFACGVGVCTHMYMYACTVTGIGYIHATCNACTHTHTHTPMQTCTRTHMPCTLACTATHSLSALSLHSPTLISQLPGTG